VLFNSLQFLAFFPVVTAAYFALPHRFRVYLLLLASCLFYMAAIPAYILILFAIILIDYGAAFQIAESTGRQRRAWLTISICANVGLLAIFKYFNFANHNLAHLARWLDWRYPIHDLRLLLPLGLSFHTFQAMSYTIEVYRGRQSPERSLPHYALYVLFYPQLVAGPIERPQNLLHQFRERHEFNYERVVNGLKLMAWGMFKKVGIADQLAVIASPIFTHPANFDGGACLLAAMAFGIQIYCDFSGYSDIAIGAAEVMGFRLMRNFRQPYLAQSIGEFWKRWHISLSTWFRDYLYVPLGGNRVSFARLCANVFLVFLISGLWHGANWTFVIWGMLHGSYRILELAAERWRIEPLRWLGSLTYPALATGIRRAWVFLLVSLTWIFFRAPDVSSATLMLRQISRPWFTGAGVRSIWTASPLFGLTAWTMGLIGLALAVLFGVDLAQNRGPIGPRVAAQPFWLRWGLYYGLLCGLLVLGVFKKNTFIYFQF